MKINDFEDYEDYLETIQEKEDEELQADIGEGFQAYQRGELRTIDEFLELLEVEL